MNHAIPRPRLFYFVFVFTVLMASGLILQAAEVLKTPAEAVGYYQYSQH
jgi:hypothetical protein